MTPTILYQRPPWRGCETYRVTRMGRICPWPQGRRRVRHLLSTWCCIWACWLTNEAMRKQRTMDPKEQKTELAIEARMRGRASRGAAVPSPFALLPCTPAWTSDSRDREAARPLDTSFPPNKYFCASHMPMSSFLAWLGSACAVSVADLAGQEEAIIHYLNLPPANCTYLTLALT